MIINVKSNNIIISELSSSFRKYQISQLKYYGFKFTNNNYIKSSDDLESDLLQIINYLNQENTEVVLTPNVNSILKNTLTKQSEFQSALNLAAKIKNGQIEKEAFETLDHFLNHLPRKLKSHQKKAAFHLYSLKNGANFSVPGSGKTSVVLAVYEKLLQEGKCNLIFVVGPPSCFQPWQDEFVSTLGRTPKVVILSGANKKFRESEYYESMDSISELYLTTFQTILNDSDYVIRFFRQQGIKPYFVVDEAHYMKQIGGAWAQSLLEVSEHAKFRCILTGTPIPRSYIDLFNLFDFLWPHSAPLNEDDKIQILYWEKNREDKSAKVLLDKKIGPLFYRVRKQDLGLKPAVFHQPAHLQMNPYEHRIYELVKSKIFELSKEDFFENEALLYKLWKGRMVRLRQAISYPKLLITAVESYEEDLISGQPELAEIIQAYDSIETPAKLQYLTKMIMDFQQKKEKVLIWSNFVGTLELIKSHFAKLGLKSELIYGKTPVRKGNTDNEVMEEMTREEIRDVFVDPKSGLDILIANPAACAESISLHKTCFHAIYYDLSYNCAQYLQSLDRIHRVGGSEVNTANYYFLQYRDSIDQDIKLNLEIKAQKMYAIVEQDYEIYNLDMFEELPEDDIAAYKRLFHKNKT